MEMVHFSNREQKQLPITILRLEGALDGDTYRKLIEKAKSLFDIGTRDLILDVSAVTHMSSAGLVALHQIVQMMCNDIVDDLDGWAALHAVANRTIDVQHHVKLLNPSPQVATTLEMAGMSDLFEIFTDLPSAVASYQFTLTPPLWDGTIQAAAVQ